ncbi:DUF3445 domain-containing protein [Actinocorallia longicatena]|uniref:DUF3445 domain-containing protein n=1 Tax=Actinocorallia longicatena TaxID=111803 RepID=A0ABP6PWZ8_9ACTN
MTLERFPFPFTRDSYRYSTNIEPARTFTRTATGGWGADVIDVDPHYAADLTLREEILASDPSRAVVLPHMRPAAWDALRYVLTELAAAHPGDFRLRHDGPVLHWENRRRGVRASFRFGDDSALPCDPLTFAALQAQEDLVLLDQREDTLWADAGVVTFAADWSLAFVIGMPFAEIHGPVPRVHEEGVVSRAQDFLLRLEPGAEFRRTNWSMTVGRRLDVSAEAYPSWGRDRRRATVEGTLAELLHLRVEVQHLIRLPASNAILFLIRTHLAPLSEIAAVPEWRQRFGRVLRELPEDMVEYKGLQRYRAAAATWLATA